MKKRENNDNLLSFLDKKRIIKKKKQNQFDSSSYNVDKERDELNKKIYIDKIENEADRLDAENFILDKKIDNAKEKNRLANYQTAIDLNEKIAENKKSKIERILKDGKKMAKRSRNAGFISAITTCFGLCKFEGKIEDKIFVCAATLFGAYLINEQSKGLEEYAEDFFEKDKKNYALSFSKIIAISCYMTFSIVTNINFWTKYYSGFSLITFSVLFDLLSLINAFESYQKLNLRFNEDTKNDINNVFDEEKNNSEEKENETQDELNAGNF